MPSPQPSRLLLLKPCCIGDVVFTTPLLAALRRAFPAAHITWAVGTHSAPVIENHPLLDAVLPTGPAANPARSPAGLLRLALQLRQGRFDLAVVPDRSPALALAVWLAGIRARAGLDSAGRGRFYSVKVPVDPRVVRHEAEIYLDIARALNLDTANCWANLPVSEEQVTALPHPLRTANGLVVVHVGGGKNPGMIMTEKRPPVALLATVAARAAAHLKTRIAILGGPEDRPRADELHAALPGMNLLSLVGVLSFAEIAALSRVTALAIGPDTGVLHLMAAAGAPTVMIFGPSDPRRYGPFVPPGRAAVAWKPYPLPEGGVAAGPPTDWSWERHGVSAQGVWEAAQTLLDRANNGNESA
ncbi:MAG: glycosyltransferase family 9 protein [Anaerolineae bacterium]|nr:glycosyltransferase family 9 protein [Anaerolineae bacterium]